MKNYIIAVLIVFFAFCIFYAQIDKQRNSDDYDDNYSDYTDDEDEEYEDPFLMEKLQSAFAESDYTEVEEITAEINESYPDSLDAAIAKEYLELLKEKQKEKEFENAGTDYKNYIQLLSATVSQPNSAGGIDLHIKFKNTSDKVIKYITFTCELYNAVDDRVADSIGNDYSFRGKVTGPINPGSIYGNNTYWTCAWYNYSGKYTKISKIQIEYMDGTKIEIPQNHIEELFY